MSKHVEFGKDIGLMAEVVRSGLSVGIGNWEFWDFLSKPQPGLWSEMRQFLQFATPEHIREWRDWGKEKSDPYLQVVGELHRQSPDIGTLDKVVRQGRENDFGHKEWQRFVENKELFQALVGYLRLEAPYSKEVEVDYDTRPSYQDDFDAGFPSFGEKGRWRREVGLYIPVKDTNINDLSLCLYDRGWRFGDQHELYAFGQAMWRQIRPWALFNNPYVYALKSLKDCGVEAYSFPRWTLSNHGKIDHFGAISNFGKNLSAGSTLLVVKL